MYTFKIFYFLKNLNSLTIMYKSMDKNMGNSTDHSPHLLRTSGLQLERVIFSVLSHMVSLPRENCLQQIVVLLYVCFSHFTAAHRCDTKASWASLYPLKAPFFSIHFAQCLHTSSWAALNISTNEQLFSPTCLNATVMMVMTAATCT